MYLDRNLTVANQAWDEINIDVGTVALDYDLTQDLGLPAAQVFPWDESKNIYLLAGYHDMHCLVRYSFQALSRHVFTIVS